MSKTCAVALATFDEELMKELTKNSDNAWGSILFII